MKMDWYCVTCFHKGSSDFKETLPAAFSAIADRIIAEHREISDADVSELSVQIVPPPESEVALSASGALIVTFDLLPGVPWIKIRHLQ